MMTLLNLTFLAKDKMNFINKEELVIVEKVF